MIHPRDLIIKIWVAFGTLGGILSLASLLDNVIAWVDFVRSLILSYRIIVDTVWGPLLDLIPIETPRWLHDYLTLCAISAIAVLWSIHNTAKELGFHQIGSTFSAFKRMFFDFSVAKSALTSFRVKALNPNSAPSPITHELAQTVSHISRQELPRIWIATNCLWILAFLGVVLGAPYLLPVLMSQKDRSGIAQARATFTARKLELRECNLDSDQKVDLGKIFNNQAENFLTFEEINKLYYSTIIRHQAWYYAGVILLFFILIFTNYCLRYFAVN